MKQTKPQAKETLQQEIRGAIRTMGMETREGSELVELRAETQGLTEWAATEVLLRRGRESVPTLLAGLSHRKGKIRATCALLLDHVADDRCVEPLRHAIRHDPLEAVRRCALHSLICDGCKECPLTTDVIAALIEAAENDRSVAVRRRAVFYLSMQRPDARAASFLLRLPAREKDPILLRRAQNALKRHLPKQEADERVVAC